MKKKIQTPLEEYSSSHIKTENGAYRWTYEANMFTNPTLFFTIVRVFVLIVVVVWLILAPFFAWNSGLRGLLGHTRMCGILFLIFLALGTVSYLILAILYHGKYTVSFELDRNYLVHRQDKKQAEIGHKIGVIASVAGILARKPSTIAAGSVAASHNVLTTQLSKVSVIKGRRWRHTIHVNQLFNKNQVFVSDEDYDFIFAFLRENCPKARIR